MLGVDCKYGFHFLCCCWGNENKVKSEMFVHTGGLVE